MQFSDDENVEVMNLNPIERPRKIICQKIIWLETQKLKEE